MCDFNNPMFCPESMLNSDFFIPSRSNMRGIPICFHSCLWIRAIISRVCTKILFGTSTRFSDAIFQHHCNLSDIIPIGSGHDDWQRDSMLVYKHVPFGSIFSPISRVGTYCFLRHWGFGDRSVNALPFPCDSFKIIIFCKPFLPQFSKESSSFPLNFCPQHINDCLENLSGIHRFPTGSFPSLIFFAFISFCLWNQCFYLFPKRIWNFPRFRWHIYLLVRRINIAFFYKFNLYLGINSKAHPWNYCCWRSWW